MRRGWRRRCPRMVMVETYAPGRELTTTVMGDRALGVTDIITDGWYDYDAKYKPGGSRHECPAKLPEEIEAACLDYALAGASGAGVPGRQPHRFPLGRGARAGRADPSGDEHPARDDADLAGARAGGACRGYRSRSSAPGWWRTRHAIAERPPSTARQRASARPGAVEMGLPAAADDADAPGCGCSCARACRR